MRELLGRESLSGPRRLVCSATHTPARDGLHGHAASPPVPPTGHARQRHFVASAVRLVRVALRVSKLRIDQLAQDVRVHLVAVPFPRPARPAQRRRPAGFACGGRGRRLLSTVRRGHAPAPAQQQRRLPCARSALHARTWTGLRQPAPPAAHQLARAAPCPSPSPSRADLCPVAATACLRPDGRCGRSSTSATATQAAEVAPEGSVGRRRTAAPEVFNVESAAAAQDPVAAPARRAVRARAICAAPPRVSRAAAGAVSGAADVAWRSVELLRSLRSLRLDDLHLPGPVPLPPAHSRDDVVPPRSAGASAASHRCTLARTLPGARCPVPRPAL